MRFTCIPSADKGMHYKRITSLDFRCVFFFSLPHDSDEAELVLML